MLRLPNPDVASPTDMGLCNYSGGHVFDTGRKIDAVRTNLPGQVEHIIAYAGATAIAMAGYGVDRHPARIIGWFWLYAGVLEFLQNFSPGRDPKLVDFAASALGALCGGLSVVALWHFYAARPSRRGVQGLSSGHPKRGSAGRV